GKLPNGQETAVKRLSIDSAQGELQFRNEVLVVAEIRHKNLVKLLGYCFEAAERVLVNEFVPNASLEHFCFGYMAPECAIPGQFSEKSDLFSFGVLVLEIISGQKNYSFQKNKKDILSY
ncbi:hypothetical protein RJ639_022931, partial [Escallonia herrerae]